MTATSDLEPGVIETEFLVSVLGFVYCLFVLIVFCLPELLSVEEDCTFYTADHLDISGQLPLLKPLLLFNR